MKVALEHRGRGGRFTERIAAYLTPEQAHEIWLTAAEEETTQAAVVRAALAAFTDVSEETNIEAPSIQPMTGENR